MVRHSTLGFLLSLGIALSIMIPSSNVYAQLDIFENKKKKKPPARRGMTFGTFTMGGSSAGKKYLRQGERLYERKNYAAASLKYFHAIKKLGFDKKKQTAQFRLAISLYQLGLLYPALHYFNQIIKEGNKSHLFRLSLSWALAISRKLKNDRPFLSKLRRFKRSDVPARFKSEFFYRLGRFYFMNSRDNSELLQKALDLLSKVPRQNRPYYARAQYIIGVSMDLNKQINDSAKAFRRSVKAALQIKNTKIRQNIFELGVLALARIHYGAKHFKDAVRYYQWIPRSSKRWLDSLFEMSYANMRRGQYGLSLGLLHTLDSPYYKNEYYPEKEIIRALSFFSRCRHKKVRKLTKSFRREYKPLIRKLKAFLKRYRTPKNLYKKIHTIKGQPQDDVAGLDNDRSGKRFQLILMKIAFKDKPLQKMFAYISELNKELDTIQRSSAVWRSSSLGMAMKRKVLKERANMIVTAGKRAKKRLRAALSHLKKLMSQSIRIQFENSRAEGELLKKSAQQGGGGFQIKIRGQKKKKTNRTFSVSLHEDFVFWPFQGEYWVDELGYYRYRIRGECRKK